MQRVWIKICGIRTVEAMRVAADAGADAIGFVFHDGSPRNLAFDEAAELARRAASGLARVAVFMHPSQAVLDAALAAVAPDWVQTDWDDLASLELPASQKVLPVLRSRKNGSEPFFALGPWKNRSEPFLVPERVLLESARSGRGERTDWTAASALAARTELVLAGGLTADNVVAAIRTVRPFGVDVSSGVESSRGVKDSRRIHDFVQAARTTDARRHQET